MTILSRGIRLEIGTLALCVASSAGAQDNLEQSKTGAQLYASYCIRRDRAGREGTCIAALAHLRRLALEAETRRSRTRRWRRAHSVISATVAHLCATP